MNDLEKFLILLLAYLGGICVGQAGYTRLTILGFCLITAATIIIA